MEDRSRKMKAESAYHERMVVGTDFAGEPPFCHHCLSGCGL